MHALRSAFVDLSERDNLKRLAENGAPLWFARLLSYYRGADT